MRRLSATPPSPAALDPPVDWACPLAGQPCAALRSGGAPPAKDAKGGKGGAAAEGGTLTLGKFTVTPQSGVVEAGGAATLTVGFKAGADAEAFANRLSIDIADRDPAVAAPDYELLAESCIPGIQTSDFGSIFEEQVRPTPNPTPRPDPQFRAAGPFF